ncbi:MAG: hypothetical protein ACKO7W_16265 [Elainella sp.]
MQIRCVIRDNTLLVLAEHLLHVEPDRRETFASMEGAVRELQPEIATDPSLGTRKSLPVQLFLRIAGYQQPYATHKFQLDLKRPVQPTRPSTPLEQLPEPSRSATPMQLPNLAAPSAFPPVEPVELAAPLAADLIAPVSDQSEAPAEAVEPANELANELASELVSEPAGALEAVEEAIAGPDLVPELAHDHINAAATTVDLAAPAAIETVEPDITEDIAAPETVAPEITALEVTAPETVAPETIALEVTAPETDAPESIEPTPPGLSAVEPSEVTPIQLDVVELPISELDGELDAATAELPADAENGEPLPELEIRPEAIAPEIALEAIEPSAVLDRAGPVAPTAYLPTTESAVELAAVELASEDDAVQPNLSAQLDPAEFSRAQPDQTDPAVDLAEPIIQIETAEISIAAVEPETVEPETVESETVEVASIEVAAVELEANQSAVEPAIELEAAELEAAEPETAELETVASAAEQLIAEPVSEVESVEVATVEPEATAPEPEAVVPQAEQLVAEPVSEVETRAVDEPDLVEMLPAETSLETDAGQTGVPAGAFSELADEESVTPTVEAPAVEPNAALAEPTVDLDSPELNVEPDVVEQALPDPLTDALASEPPEPEPPEPEPPETATESDDSQSGLQEDAPISLEELIAEAALTGVAVEAARVEHDAFTEPAEAERAETGLDQSMLDTAELVAPESDLITPDVAPPEQVEPVEQPVGQSTDRLAELSVEGVTEQSQLTDSEAIAEVTTPAPSESESVEAVSPETASALPAVEPPQVELLQSDAPIQPEAVQPETLQPEIETEITDSELAASEASPLFELDSQAGVDSAQVEPEAIASLPEPSSTATELEPSDWAAPEVAPEPAVDAAPEAADFAADPVLERAESVAASEIDGSSEPEAVERPYDQPYDTTYRVPDPWLPLEPSGSTDSESTDPVGWATSEAFQPASPPIAEEGTGVNRIDESTREANAIPDEVVVSAVMDWLDHQLADADRAPDVAIDVPDVVNAPEPDLLIHDLLDEAIGPASSDIAAPERQEPEAVPHPRPGSAAEAISAPQTNQSDQSDQIIDSYFTDEPAILSESPDLPDDSSDDSLEAAGDLDTTEIEPVASSDSGWNRSSPVAADHASPEPTERFLPDSEAPAEPAVAAVSDQVISDPAAADQAVSDQVASARSSPNWAMGGLIGAVALAGGIYMLSRPCVIGSCEQIQLSQDLNRTALETVQSTDSAMEVVDAYKQLNEASYLLGTIPIWSPHYGKAQALLANYETQSVSLGKVVEALEQANTAAKRSQNPPHPLQEWREIQWLWREVVEKLEKVPADSVANGLTQRKLQEYKTNLADINQRVVIEQQAQDRITAARQVGQRAEAQAGAAESAENWQETATSWTTAIEQLQQIPSGTNPYDEAQQLLAVYQPKRAQAIARQGQENTAATAYTQAVEATERARRLEQQNQWVEAANQWQNALTFAQQVPADSAYYGQVKPLIDTYSSTLQQAQVNSQRSSAIQTAKSEFDQACDGSPTICTYTLSPQAIRVQFTPVYDQTVARLITNTQGSNGFPPTIVNQVNGLLRSLADISDLTQVPIELYNSNGTKLGTYTPALAGYVPQ